MSSAARMRSSASRNRDRVMLERRGSGSSVPVGTDKLGNLRSYHGSDLLTFGVPSRN